MKFTLHRRYPGGDHWEIDPEPMGSIIIDMGKVILDMEDTPVKNQIRNMLDRPIMYINGMFGSDSTTLRVVDKTSGEYTNALVSELRRLGIEARRQYPAIV